MTNTVWDIVSQITGPRTIGAPGRSWLDGESLRGLVGMVRTALGSRGTGAGDRVAIVLPNGPEMATAFLAVAATCCAAPLNFALREEEFEFYLSDMQPTAILLLARESGPVREVVDRMRIPILTLHTEADWPAGLFRLDTSTLPAAPVPARIAAPSDAALVLHTSGTTAHPKLVTLTNANLAASAHHIVATLALNPGDTCLNIMPLFHIHGLIAAVLSSLSAGASVSCTPGFNAFRFGEWLAEVQPTWYTAVPTMHQAILMRMRPYVVNARASKLRFIRSSSASLPPQVMAELESLFGVPVIEAYGMTEAAHQMTSNPLPPRARKPGTVGLPAGPNVEVMDDDGAILPLGSVGEVVIRGANVTPGYDNNPLANAKAFDHGWFRTGDQGWMDKEGYLVLTGRLKEQINRGGQKISPLEVDVVLLDHPSIAQACTFGIPHDKLGEEVGTVVVPRPGCTLTESDVREFAATRLAAFKVPRRVIFMGDIPKSSTGKMQRIGLAIKLGLAKAATIECGPRGSRGNSDRSLSGFSA